MYIYDQAHPTAFTTNSSLEVTRRVLTFFNHSQPVPSQIQEKMAFKIIFAVALVFVLAEAQRPFYAGRAPIGYPAVESESLGNRFGEDADLPILANGDGNLINRLNSMPIDNQPFWYLNWRAYNDLRNRPQTYPLKPNNFIN